MEDLPDNKAPERHTVTAEGASVFTRFSFQVGRLRAYEWLSRNDITPAHMCLWHRALKERHGFTMEMFVFLLTILPCVAPKTLFNPPEGSESSLRFAVIGDWGGLPLPPYHTKQEAHVAAELGRTVANWGADFILSVGDNFYYDGVKNVTDPRFKWLVEVEVKTPMDSHKNSVNGKFPDLYYDLSFKIPDTNASVRLLMLDTIVLCGNSDDFHEDQPMVAANPKMANIQLDWLIKKLETAKDDYVLVVGHYPVWSIAEHGPTHCLLHHVEPLLKKYKVTAYLSGHDHNMQYLQDDSGIGYVLSGAGNFMENSRKHEAAVPMGYLRFFLGEGEPMGSFAYIKITAKKMDITYIQSGGKSLFQTTLHPRQL
ncbi:hypothetical protein AB205_0183150 [Aquarana catesbeiana]|uniref:Tartrate-resistant acid phosphatase type 5 n=1 Tax=Aquarana catesbeiana TaxID=8400 RepID=A0A2G9SJF6_AQUCT|nr:hypothetical protein AB205_0183150 [Aquarana catesbeiana]